MLKQPQYAPMPVEQQVMIIYAVTNGLLDDVPTNRIRAFEHGFHEFMRAARRPQVGETIRESGKLEKDTIDALVGGVEEYKQEFQQRSSRRAETAAEAGSSDASANTDLSTPGNPLA
jgi:F-type H+/Na+-transporting ATPase subunit alpha